MSETQSASDLPIDEILADFLVKKISKKKSKKHKRKKEKYKSRSTHKNEVLKKRESDESDQYDVNTGSTTDIVKSHKKSHYRHRSYSRSKHKSSRHKHEKHSKSHSTKSVEKRQRSESHSPDLYYKRTWKKEKGSNPEEDEKECSFKDCSEKPFTIKKEKIEKITDISAVDSVQVPKDTSASYEKTSHVALKLDCSTSDQSELSKVSVQANFAAPSNSSGNVSDPDSKNRKMNFKIDLDISAVVKEVMSDVINNKGVKHRTFSSDSSEKSTGENFVQMNPVTTDSHSKGNEDFLKKSVLSGSHHQSVDVENSKDKSHKRSFQFTEEEERFFKKRKGVKDNSGNFEKWGKQESEYERKSLDRSEEYKSEKSSKRNCSNERRDDRKKTSEKETDRIDKAKLLEIARRNVLSMIEKGTLPQSVEISALKKEALLTIKSGGNSVEELTEFCRTLSEKESKSYDDVPSKDNNHDENEQPFIHHPFKLKEPSVIKMNIKNSVPLPIKTHAEKVTANARTLSLQFPVSSGNQHRQKEFEWIPVEKKAKLELASAAPSSTAPFPRTTAAQSSPPALHLSPPLPVVPPPPPPPPPPDEGSYSMPNSFEQMNFTNESSTPLLPSPSLHHVAPVQSNIVMPSPCFSNSSYSAEAFRNLKKPINLQEIVTQRFKAMQKLQGNPYDFEAIKCIQEAQMKMQMWVESKQVPGQFTGSTNAKVLRPDELCGPRPVWVKKDFFSKAAPVTGGKGMSLLRKMGWNPGEGLGKNKEGALEPLFLNIKMDKKGLVAEADKKVKVMPSPITDVKKNIMIEGKHPVSMLMELCSKKKWSTPAYSEVSLEGPPYKKQFLYKVLVNGSEYQPATPRNIKKLAKADAATCCLKALGFLPPTYGN